MKKILCLLLCVSFCLLCLPACTGRPLSLGLGVVITPAANKAEISVTAAAVTLKANGRIEDCKIDVLSSSAKISGTAMTLPTDYKTKGEKGDAYNMKTYGGSISEWYEQADAFCYFVKGKTAEQVKSLVGENGKSTDSALTSVCTIVIDDFTKAVVKACENATESSATKGDELVLGFYGKDGGSAFSENGGTFTLSATIGAFTVKDGKVTAARIDAADTPLSLTASGVPAQVQSASLTQREKEGATEWKTTADAFETFVCNKTAAEIASGSTADSADMVRVVEKVLQ